MLCGSGGAYLRSLAKAAEGERETAASAIAQTEDSVSRKKCALVDG